MANIVQVRVYLWILWLFSVSKPSFEQRSKRFLTFPPTSPTRVQIISGIGIPVDLELESVTIGYVFKAEFFLPENASDFLNPLANPFDVSTYPISGFFDRRKRMVELPKPTEMPRDAIGFDSEQNEAFEKHTVDAEIIESGSEPEQTITDEDSWFRDEPMDRKNDPLRPIAPQSYDTSRWTIYKGFEALAEKKGLSGHSCVLRSICEAAHTPFDYSNGILGELMHIVMSPSSTNDEITEHSDYEYYRAEKMGKEGVPCERVFKECKASILNQFSGIYTPVMNLLSRIMS